MSELQKLPVDPKQYFTISLKASILFMMEMEEPEEL